MKVAPFRLISDRELLGLRHALAPAIGEWSRRWLGSREAAGLADVRRPTLTEGRFEGEHWHWDHPDRGLCIMQLAGEVRQHWSAAMLKAESPFDADAPLVVELWMASAAALIDSISSVMKTEVQPSNRLPRPMPSLPRGWLRPGSGIVELEFDADVGPIAVLMEGYMPSALPGGPDERPRSESGLAPLQRALVGQPLFAEVNLASEEMALGELLSLQPGDVIALGQRCDEPVSMRIANTDVMLAGHLGRYGENKAFIVDGATTETTEEEIQAR